MPTDTRTLPELAGRVDHLRSRLFRALDQAGSDFDLTKVREFDGSSSAKLDAIRATDREIEDLTSLVEARIDLVGTALGPSAPSSSRPSRKSLGERFVKSQAFKRPGSGTAEIDVDLDELGLGVKSTLTTFSENYLPYRGSSLIEPAAEQPPNLAQSVVTIPWSEWNTRYLEETSATNAAAPVAEAATYPEAAIDLEAVLKRLRKIGVTLPLTDELAEDEQGAQDYVNSRLTSFVQEELDDQLLNGDGTGQNLLGFHSTTGINSTTYASGASVSAKIAAALAGAGEVASNGMAIADSIVIGASDWWAMLAATTSAGEFLFLPGQPPASLFGLKPIVTTRQTSGRMLVGALAQHARLFARPAVDIAMSREHSDFFATGKLLVRVKLPAWLAVLRPAAFASITQAS